jgi:hypothetical protein
VGSMSPEEVDVARGRIALLAILVALVSVVALVGMTAAAGIQLGAQLPAAAGTTPAAAAPGSTAPAVSTPPPASNIGMYAGLGTWIDIYDASAWNHPKRTVKSMRAHGVRTIYLQTSNFSRTRAIMFREPTDRIINIAHHLGMKVVAWYLPGLKTPDVDFQRAMAAINLTTKSGGSFDSFGLDIESAIVQPPSERTSRLLALSSRLRATVGPNYRLGAIIPSPRGMQKHPGYWPDFPYQQLQGSYDVFLPMTYFTYRVSGQAGARRYTAMNINITRRETGNPDVPIHIIGGISNDATTPETRGFVQAVLRRHVWGASYYGFVGTTRGQWKQLRRVPVPSG